MLAPPTYVQAEARAASGTLASSSAQRTQDAPGGAADSDAPTPLRMVVVDDEADVRSAMAAMARRLGHEVTTCGCAEEALAHLETAAADVVVSDYAMPGTTGLELLGALRERGEDELVFVLVTGYAPPRLAEEATRRPRALLRKPFTMRELEAAIAGVSRRSVA